MRISCEHCGSSIDVEKDKVCPSCGAPYNKNREYKEMKEYLKQKEENERKQQIANEQFNKTVDKVFEGFIAGQQKASMFGSVIVVIVIIVIGLIAFNIYKQTSNMEFEEQNFNINEDVEKEKIEVSFNEQAIDEDFEIKCNKITNYKYNSLETEKYRGEDIDYYNFNIVFKSKSDSIKLLTSISLVYNDSDGNDNISAKRHMANTIEQSKQLDLYVSDKLTHTGNVTFEIPKNVKNVKILYDNVTIKIDNFKDNIK